VPYLYRVDFIRKHIKITKTIPKKEEIPELVAGILNINFPYVYNRNKRLSVENGDMADAIAAALCYCIIEKNGLEHSPPPKKKKKVKKKNAQRRSS
jgi:hypothetical protein